MNNLKSYILLDAGGGRKVEMVGDYKMIRPSPQAIWEPFDESLWQNADTEFERTTGEKGVWRVRKVPDGVKRRVLGMGVPETWEITNKNGTIFNIEPNQFGNIGVFTEHWSYTDKLLELFDKRKPVLNLFTYTGSSCMDLAKKGYKIVAVDSSKSSLNGYTQNLQANNVDRKGHKIVLEDCEKFVLREIRRGNKYASIMVDAPSFGRGTKGEVFNIEDDFVKLIKNVAKLLQKDGKVIITNHSPRFTPKSLEITVAQIFKARKVEVSEIVQKAQSGAELPSGYLVVVS